MNRERTFVLDFERLLLPRMAIMGPERSEESDIRVKITENATLLQLLSKDVPGQPSFNRLEELNTDTRERVLSLETECRLADIFSFFARFNNDKNSIPAVRVEERLSPRGLVVRVAINRSEPQSGALSLQRIKECFDGIFDVLSKGKTTYFYNKTI